MLPARTREYHACHWGPYPHESSNVRTCGDEEMAEDELSVEEQRQLAQLVAKSLSEGRPPAEIVEQLVDSGWEPQAANEFVGSVVQYMADSRRAASQPSGGSSGQQWLVWIAVLLIINFLSWLFGWPFWIY